MSRRFPISLDRLRGDLELDGRDPAEELAGLPSDVPWDLVDECAGRVRERYGVDPEELAAVGGLPPSSLMALARGGAYVPMDELDALRRLRDILDHRNRR